MIERLVMYSRGVVANFGMPLEQVFDYNVRFQILCDTQEQKDYLTAMQLMFGREVDIRTWDEWNKRKATVPLEQYFRERDTSQPEHIDQFLYTAKEQLLPIYFCTSVQRHDR